MVRSNAAGHRSPLIDAPPGTIARITSLTASRDAATVQRIIQEKYGFLPTLEYCAALVDFVEALTDGQK